MTNRAIAERIGGRIRMLREAHRLSQTELADRLNITQPSVSQWETGRATPTLPMQRALADELQSRRSIIFAELVEAEDHEAAA